MTKFLSIMATMIFLAACSSTPTKTKPTYVPEGPLSLPPASPQENIIDYDAIQNTLGLNRSADQLGFAEKSFNTCEVGYGYPSNQNCRKQYYVVIQFKLSCRDSEGTISQVLTDNDVTPLSRRTVRWNIKGSDGTVETDNDGYGQIRTITSAPAKRERVKLSLGNEFLYMHANEISKVITPKPWCTSY